MEVTISKKEEVVEQMEPPHFMCIPIFFGMMYSFSYVANYFELVGKWYGFPTFVLLIFIHIVVGMALYSPFSDSDSINNQY